MIQRVTGQTVGPFFAKEVAGPLGLDCYIGVPDAELPRVVQMVLAEDPETVQLGLNVPEFAGPARPPWATRPR